MSAILDRPLEQRLEALKQANWVRSRRAELKRDLKAGRVTPASLLLAPPEWATTMKAIDLLMAVPKMGTVKVLQVLKVHGISPSKSLGGLSSRQRAELAGAMRARRTA